MKKISGFNDPNDYRVREEQEPKVNRKIEPSEEKHKDSHKNKQDDFEQLLEKKGKKSSGKPSVAENFAPSIFDLASSSGKGLKKKKSLFSEAVNKLATSAKEEEEVPQKNEKKENVDLPKIKGVDQALLKTSSKISEKKLPEDKPLETEKPEQAKAEPTPVKTPKEEKVSFKEKEVEVSKTPEREDTPPSKKIVRSESKEAPPLLPPDKKMEETTHATPLEKGEKKSGLPKEIVRLVEKMIAKLTTTEKGKDFKTTFVVKSEGAFNGAKITLQHARSAEKEFNIEFRDLGEKARALLDAEGNKESLKLALSEKGYTIHLISAPYENREKEIASPPPPFKPEESGMAQGEKRERDSSDQKEEEEKQA